MLSKIQGIINSHKKKRLISSLSRFEFGELTLNTPEGETYEFKGIKPGLRATFTIHDWNVLTRTLRHGDIGFGESFMLGEWSSPDPISLCILLLQNVEHVMSHYYGSRIFSLFSKFLHWSRPNTLKGSRKNISSHYDLGNDFYKVWLDETMTYSSGLYLNHNDSPRNAQINKYQRILDQLEDDTHNILEIGCGWGGFAEFASQKGYEIQAITISEEQASFAKERLKDHKQTEVSIQDYRQVKAKYDAIVSIEMFEAVGENYWPEYFSIIKKNLKSGGRAVIQTITVKDENFEDYRSCVDFIQKHIFPGGMLPSAKIFNDLAMKAGLQITNAYEFGHSYYLTLKQWLEAFDANKDKVFMQGYSDDFIRKWRIYLAFCAANFYTGRTQVYQFTLCHVGDESINDIECMRERSAT